MSSILGMPTLIEFETLEQNVDLCRQLGLSFIDLNMNLPMFCPDALDAASVRRISAGTGIGFTVHLPEDTNLASFHPSVREGHLRCCAEALTWAADAGIGLANMHMNAGVYFSLPDRRVWIYEQHRERYLANMLDGLSRLYDLVGPGLTLAIENAGDFSLPFVSAALALLSKIEGFALTWDIGHDAGSGYSDRPIIESHANHVRHMHLHDFNGSSSHQVLFDGVVDVVGMLSLAEHRNWRVVLEVKTAEALTESVRRLDARRAEGG